MSVTQNAASRSVPVAAFVFFLVIALGGLCILLVRFVGNWLGSMLG
ncbi:MAG: hypothetical protein KBG84_12630 [Planctomycetes bacterium]|jgi:hypothetical protein|nr:hypothetical protein [Planctomycetota bacterium]